MKYGWHGKAVRNADGRTGTIVMEDGWVPILDLHIECKDGTQATVRLNARGCDGGEPGWQYWCPNFSGGPAWLPLGDQGAQLEYADASTAEASATQAPES